LLPQALRVAVPAIAPIWIGVFHQPLVAHVILVCLMLVASLIDIDEKTIPDAVVVPGTLIGLILATVWPRSLLPEVVVGMGKPVLRFLWATSPNPWPPMFAGFPHFGSLLVGLVCWWLWCVALMPRTWYPRHGFRRACGLCWARVVREPVSYRLAKMGLVGSIVIFAVWFRGEIALVGLLSALIGLAGGGGVVWLVRIIGAAALRREAMGFGDVTLMAMIGAFLGWQTCLVIFFLAPFAALVIGVVQLVVRRDSEIPYGPFLCLATLVVIVRWADIWDRTYLVFGLGWFVPVVVLACMGLMGLMLGAWQWLKCRFL